MTLPDLDRLSLPELIALSRALVLAISAAKAGGGQVRLRPAGR